MPSFYDNWVKLVAAVDREEQLRKLCYATSMSSGSSDSTCPSPLPDSPFHYLSAAANDSQVDSPKIPTRAKRSNLWKRKLGKPEARGDAVLHASLERRKQVLYERRLALEQDVARLQEQLQAERDLRAQFEEMDLVEADVARLNHQVSELHHQLTVIRNPQQKQRTEDLLGTDMRNIKGQLFASGNSSRQGLHESSSSNSQA